MDNFRHTSRVPIGIRVRVASPTRSRFRSGFGSGYDFVVVSVVLHGYDTIVNKFVTIVDIIRTV